MRVRFGCEAGTGCEESWARHRCEVPPPPSLRGAQLNDGTVRLAMGVTCRCVLRRDGRASAFALQGDKDARKLTARARVTGCEERAGACKGRGVRGERERAGARRDRGVRRGRDHEERAGRVKGILPFYGNGFPIFLRYCTGLDSGLLSGRLKEPLSHLFCCKYNRKGAFNAVKRRSSAYARTLR